MTSWRIELIVAWLLLEAAGPAYGHGGALNAEGCHNNRKTGDYHCHRAAAAPTPPRQAVVPPARVDANGLVKKSRNGICHAPGTTYYDRTLNFVTFKTLEACIASGGRMPRR